MKKLSSLICFVLLTCHLLAVPVLLLCIRGDFQELAPSHTQDEWLTAKVSLSLPYPNADPVWQDTGNALIEKEGKFYNLVQEYYENDTLYIQLKTNIPARDQFAAISGLVHDQLTKHPAKPHHGKLTHLLKDWLKAYVSPGPVQTLYPSSFGFLASVSYPVYNHSLPEGYSGTHTPPPRIS